MKAHRGHTSPLRACDGASTKGAVYSAFCSSTSVKSAVGLRQLWQSLPIAPKLLASVVLGLVCLWIANSAAITKQLVDCNGKDPLCVLEHRQITIATLVAQLLYSVLVMNAIYEEDSFQLLASSVLSIASCLLWLVFMTAVKLSSTASRVGFVLGFTAATTIIAWLAYLTYQQFGWRIHSQLACDVRRKHAADKQHCYFALSRFRTLLKLTTVAALLNAACTLAVALGFRSTAATALIDSNTSHLAFSGLLTVGGLHCLPLLWLAVTYLAVRFNNNKLELLSTATMLFLLLLPVLVLYWTFNPAYRWPGTVAVRVLLLAMPIAAWVVLHCATWRTMRHVLCLFRGPHVKELIADMMDDLPDQHQDLPEQLQPLLKGAWLLKVRHQPAGSAAGTNAADVVRRCSKLGSDAARPHQPRVSNSTWAIPVFNSFRQPPSSNAGGQSWLQWQPTAPSIALSSNRWRFFQLSTDFTTLRWSWNKYILLYYVDSLEVDADMLTITLHMALDPDLTLAFTDPRVFDQWESALQLVLLMLTGAAPGTTRTAAHSIESAGAAEASAGCFKDGLPGLMSMGSYSSGSIPSAGLGVSNRVAGMAGAASSSPHPVSQHSLVMTALTVQQQLKTGQSGWKHGGAVAAGVGSLDGAFLTGAAKLRRSTSSFFSASRRQSVTDPHAMQLQQAQALAEALTRQLSSNVPTQIGPSAGSNNSWLSVGLLQQQLPAEHRQHEEWWRLQRPAHEHRWWLQQKLESSTIDMPAAGDVKPAAANSAGTHPAAPAALAWQLDLPPHQALNHVQQKLGGTHQVPATATQGSKKGHSAADSLHLCRSAAHGQQSSNTSPSAVGSGFGPFRTPPGLLKHMQLAEQNTQQHPRLHNLVSSSDDSSAARLAPIALNPDAFSNSIDSALTGTSHANSLRDPQHLQCQGSVSTSSGPPCWPYSPAARGSSPSRLQQQVPDQALWQPVVPAEHHHTPHNQQQQQALAQDVYESDGEHARLMQDSSAGRSGYEYSDPSSSPEASLRSKSALLMRTNITPDTTSPAAGWGHSRQGLTASGDDWGLQQQPARQQPVRQFYEQQYSQPPSPNIYGVYTSAALSRRDESLIMEPATYENSGLLRANSMPAALRSRDGGCPVDTTQTPVRQYVCTDSGHVHDHDAGPAVRACIPELATSATVFDPATAKQSQQVHMATSPASLQPVEHSKTSTPLGIKPPAMEDMVDNAGAIPAVWELGHGPAVAVIGREQQRPWHAAWMPVAAPSDRATAGGSELCLESPGSGSQTSPEQPEFLQVPSLISKHLSEAAGAGTNPASIGSSNSNANVHQQQYSISSVGTGACAAQQRYSLQQGNNPFLQEQNAVLVRFDSGHATLGSDSTSRAVSLLQAGLPPFDAIMAQVEGDVWQDTAAHWAAASTSQHAALQTATEPAVRHSVVNAASTHPVPPFAAAATAAVVDFMAGVRPSDTPESDRQQRRQQSSIGGGSAWRTSLHNIVATVAQVVSGGGAASPRSRNLHIPNAPAGTTADHASTIQQSPAPISRLQMSPFYNAATTAAAAAVGDPGLSSPSRSASAAALRIDSVPADNSRSITPAGGISYDRRLYVAEASGRASSGSPSRISVGSLTAGGWSDLGRSTMRSTLADWQSTTDSVIDMSGDSGLIDEQLARGNAAITSAAGTRKTNLMRSSGSFNMFSFNKRARSACERCDAATNFAQQASSSSVSSRQHCSDSADVATTAAASCNSGQQEEGQVQQPNQTAGHPMAGCVTSNTQQWSQSTNALPTPASKCKFPQAASAFGASPTPGRCHSMGDVGAGQVLSAQTMPLPVLPEAPAAAELDSTDAADELDTQQQHQQQHSGSNSSGEGRPTALVQQVQQQVQDMQAPRSDKQDDCGLCSFTFAASSQQEQPVHQQQPQQQPIKLQGAYQLVGSTAAGAVTAELVPSANPWPVEVPRPRSPQGQRLDSMVAMQPGYASSSVNSSPGIGAARPATRRVSDSDAATASLPDTGTAAAAAAAAAVGSLTASPRSPRIKSYPSMDSLGGVGRLHVRVPNARRQPGQDNGEFPYHHSPFAHHGTHYGSMPVHQQQLAHHDDGYVINSPGSLVSFNSHVSAYTDGSPRTGRTFRQSVGSAGFGGSLQLTNSLCMAYSGWSSRSGGSCRSATTFRKGLAPQVSVELIDWHTLQVGRTIGRGAEGCVFEARYQDAPIAVKEGPSMNEIEMYLAAGVHDNLVGLRGLCQKDDGTWCLLLEYCSRGTLDTLVHHSRSPLPRATHQHTSSSEEALVLPQQHHQPQQSRQDLPKLLPFMRGIARGLLHLHSRKPAILHRDIKPANIFIGHGMVMKIGDFGMSRLVYPVAADAQDTNPAAAGTSRRGSANATRGGGSDNGRPHWVRSSLAGARHSSGNGVATPTGATRQHQAAKQTAGQLPNRTLTPGVVGTLCYTAPELLDEQLQGPTTDADSMLKADVYSFGVTVWEMVERRRPFEGMDGMQICALWIADPERMVLPPLTVGDNASDFDKRVLAALQDLVQDCTALIPGQRPPVNQVLTRIKHIQRLYDPRAAPAHSSKGGDVGAVASGQESIGAAAQQAADCALCPAASDSDSKEHAGQQQLQLSPSEQGDQGSAVTVQEGRWRLLGFNTSISHGPPAPGVTDPAVAAAIAAALHTPAAKLESCADNNSDHAATGTQQPLLGQVAGSGSVMSYRRSTSESGAAYRARLGGVLHASNGLAHSSSLPSGQPIVLPDLRHLALAAERRLSGAGLHHRHVR